MIKNERQFRITKAEAERFEQALKDLEASPEDKRLHPALRKAQLDAIRSQLADLLKEIEEYQALQARGRAVLRVSSFAGLPSALIKARIASGMTQEDLAKRVGVKAQQIQRYEATDYESASLTRVAEVIQALDVEVKIELLA